MRPAASLWRLLISAAIAGVLLVLVVNTITAPVEAETRSYTADFTDAAGLHAGADVRVRGLRVGKVVSVDLARVDDQSIASVAFTLDKRYGVVQTTRLAIKYQALTGLRFIDVMNPSQDDPTDNSLTHVSTAMTQPSFDITTLFNGLEPVLATLSPDDLNTFTANAEAFLQGDGNGLAPLLDSIRTLTRLVSDRQQLIKTLVRNLSDIAHAMGGRSQDAIRLLTLADSIGDAALTLLEELRKADLYGPKFTSTVVQLLDNVGITPGIDIDAALDRAFTNVDDTMEAIKLVPVMWENIPPPSPAGTPVPCTRGRAQLPADLDVLLNGQRVMICNR